MQKSKFHSELEFLKFCFLSLFFFFYQTLTLINIYFPPFLGFLSLRMLIHKYKKEKDIEIKDNFSWYFSVIFLIIIEQIHNFYLFSSALSFIFINYILRDILLGKIKSRFLLIFVFIFVEYFGTFFITNIYLNFTKQELLTFGFFYLYYIFFEALFASLFLERIR